MQKPRKNSKTAYSRQDSDARLVQKVQAGERAAFDILVNKYQYRIRHVVACYIREPSDVHDVMQEAFIHAYKALPKFRGDSQFYTWMYRITINCVKNFYAQQNRHTSAGGVDMPALERCTGRFRMRDYATPEHFAVCEEVEIVLAEAIETLPEVLRTALILREVEGCSYERIATIMSCPIGTVRSRISRARETIDTHIQRVLQA